MPKMLNRSRSSEVIGIVVGAAYVASVGLVVLLVTGVVSKVLYLVFMVGWDLL